MNNAGIGGVKVDLDKFSSANSGASLLQLICFLMNLSAKLYIHTNKYMYIYNYIYVVWLFNYIFYLLQLMQAQTPADVSKTMSQTYEAAEECLQTNYYGAKRMAESLIPYLQLSDSPRIVNVSSSIGKLQVYAKFYGFPLPITIKKKKKSLACYECLPFFAIKADDLILVYLVVSEHNKRLG